MESMIKVIIRKNAAFFCADNIKKKFLLKPGNSVSIQKYDKPARLIKLKNNY
jgi:hypothetical protein